MGGLNGREENDGMEWWLGKQGKKARNTNGKIIINSCMKNELVIANSHLRHRRIHQITWEISSRKEKSIIDYFVISRNIWRNVKDIRIKKGYQIWSSNFLLTMKW